MSTCLQWHFLEEERVKRLKDICHTCGHIISSKTLAKKILCDVRLHKLTKKYIPVVARQLHHVVAVHLVACTLALATDLWMAHVFFSFLFFFSFFLLDCS